MFYFLSKTAGYFLTPAGWLLASLVGALLFPRQRRRLLIVSLGLFWLLGNRFVVNELARIWEVDGQTALAPRTPTDTTFRVAVLLTGGTTNTQLAVLPARPMLAREADRLGQALFLYKSGRVQKILISGGGTDLFFMNAEALHEGQQGMRFLHLAGVPVRDLLWETRSRNTHENARFSARILRQKFHTNRCVLVTSAFHLRRATACFAKAGVQATPFPAAYIQTPRTVAPGDWLVPREDAFVDAMHLVKEMIGYVTYTLTGYI